MDRLGWNVGWLACAALALAAMASGCSSCTSYGECTEGSCPAGEICSEGRCVVPTCENRNCGGGQICKNGNCVPGPVQCDEMGETCDTDGASADGYVCNAWGNSTQGTCSRRCDESRSCPTGSTCLSMPSVLDSPCPSEGSCPDNKTCFQGTCRELACRPSECEGLLEGDSTCQDKYSNNPQFPDGAKCFPVANEASLCLPAGLRSRGETCQSIRRVAQSGDFSETCRAGLLCTQGTCTKICRGDDDCVDGESCVGVEGQGTVRAGIGRCANTCEPFTEGACSEDETCRPIGDGNGRCVDAGQTEVFASCQPGQGECEKGSVCVTYQEGQAGAGTEVRARCHPLCDLTAGERQDDGSLSEAAQRRRDATCPQNDPPSAGVRLVHTVGPPASVDWWESDGSSPIAEALGVGTASSGESNAYVEVEPGQFEYFLQVEGDPPTELPVAEWSTSLGPGEAKVFATVAPEPGDEQHGVATLSAPSRSGGGEGPRVRFAHLWPETGPVDIYATPPGATPGDGDATVQLASGLEFEAVTGLAGVSAGERQFWVFPAGASPSNTGEALLDRTRTVPESDRTFFLAGTVDPTDPYSHTELPAVDAAPTPEWESPGPEFTCVEANGGEYGYCQQVCSDGAEDYGTGICRGDGMGCRPTLRNDLQRREHLCGPVGEGRVGDTCNPYASVGQCAEGNYCLEYGNTREGFTGPRNRGVCHSLCSVDGGGSDALGCQGEKTCQALDYRGNFDVGQCGFPCEPNDQFTDESACPRGLRSCTPVASLEGPLAGQGNRPPDVQQEQSYCSASGNVPPESSCRARNCQSTAECLYPRHQASGFVDSMLSPYTRAQGQSPACRARCDPFDGEDAPIQCGSGETCLFNYPWSAEVGHCAEMTEELAPGESCSTPGLACGEHSICVDRGGETPVCTQFCQYQGPTADGGYRQANCTNGYTCRPLVRDVGICEQGS